MTVITLTRANEILRTWQHYRDTVLRTITPDSECNSMRLAVPMTADQAMRMVVTNEPAEMSDVCHFIRVHGKHADRIECQGLIVHEW